jgi:hypothetical protein
VNKSSTLKSALVVVGGSLAAAPAAALELGEVKVHSTLGQPLRASIAYALGPNEAVSDTCVTLQPNMARNGLPSLGRASMIVTDGVIAITGSSIVREPLMTMRVNIRCPYTAQLTREYMMFIDPAGITTEPIAAPVASRQASRPQISAPIARQARTAVRRRPVSREPIVNAARYQVQPGDSLSEIAQRIENRPIALWDAVSMIFDMNPDAFINNDPDKLKAGSWLSIPNFDADAAVTVAGISTRDVTPVETETAGTVYEPAEFDNTLADLQPGTETTSTAYEPAEPDNPLADLQPGDVILDSDNPFVTPIDSVGDESVVIPDTFLDGPVTASDSPNVPVATIQPAAPSEPTTTNWLLWLGGGGVAIILGLLLFGRRFRDQFGSTPIAPAAPQRRATDGDTQEVEAVGDFDTDIADDSPTAENLALDADLIVGTGLQDGADVDVAQDFGFAATTDLDFELPDEMSSGAETLETDIIPPIRADESSILESEVLPDEEDDYDMSVIVDATKMPHPDDVTERDLEAVQVDSGDETLIADDYTVSQEVDYKIIEQDYEDEMTATQALNAEIQKAAEELAVRLDEDDAADETAEIPLATVHELDVTAQLPAKNEEEIGDDDDTGINPTVDTEAEDKTVEMAQDNTVEMPKNDSKAG